VLVCDPNVVGGYGVYEALAKLPEFYAGGIALAAVDDGFAFNKSNCNTPLWAFLNKREGGECGSA